MRATLRATLVENYPKSVGSVARPCRLSVSSADLLSFDHGVFQVGAFSATGF